MEAISFHLYQNNQNYFIIIVMYLYIEDKQVLRISLIILSREEDIWVELINSVVVGYSDNLGKPNTGYTRSYPSTP